METAKAERPLESPADPDPVSRLVQVLRDEGFEPLSPDDDPQGERIYRREEKVLFANGETVFVLIDFPSLDEKVLTQAIEGITHLFKAKNRAGRALAVLQPTTVYVCIIARNESPHNESLNRYITSRGGAVIIPVVVVPEINQVVYPSLEEKVGTIRPRIEYLQYLLGERRDAVDMHRQTVKTFYVSAAFLGVLLVAALVSMLA